MDIIILQDGQYIHILQKIIKLRLISHGFSSDHSFFVKNDNILYASGYNGYYNCGINDNNNNLYNPTLIKHNIKYKIIDIICGGCHSLFIDNKYNIYGCGSNRYYQLSLPELKIYKSISYVIHFVIKIFFKIFY